MMVKATDTKTVMPTLVPVFWLLKKGPNTGAISESIVNTNENTANVQLKIVEDFR